MPANRPVLIDEDTNVVDALDEMEARRNAFAQAVEQDVDDEAVFTLPNADREAA